MIIHNIRITNFKSIYGPQEFDFDGLSGLVKLSGPIGVGKTVLAEAILYGLYGSVKGQNNPELVSWNTRECVVEMNITSSDKEIHIIRSSREPLIIEVNGSTIPASSKKNSQQILEDELYDVPKLAMIKMCIISFNAFNSLANMSAGETKQFLDDIFSFKLFSDYNDVIVAERKNVSNELAKLTAIYESDIQYIEELKQKKQTKHDEITSAINIDELNVQREELTNNGIALKKEKDAIIEKYTKQIDDINSKIREIDIDIAKITALGKQARTHYNTLKSGTCPTCGQPIDAQHILMYKNETEEYEQQYKKCAAQKSIHEYDISTLNSTMNEETSSYDTRMNELRNKIININTQIQKYNNDIQTINENYDDLIADTEKKVNDIKERIDMYDREIAEWNEMSELFTKTLRYKLLSTLIPQINKSIKFFINKLGQPFNIRYDEEFKAHISVDSYDKEIKYNSLSTGQKKTLDLAIIFGILHNLIANIDCNILFLDELFSNMDADLRNTMLALLKESMSADKTIFVINHSEMQDDYFSHKIRVRLVEKELANERKHENMIVRCSRYEVIF